MFKEVGHFLLKRLGKTKLRPGGITATNWLLKQVQFTADTKVLEVACNEAETLMCLATVSYTHLTLPTKRIV